MSEADKMFADLGYKYINLREREASYQDDERPWGKEITFHYNEKSYTAIRNSFDHYINETRLCVGVELHMAINEKMKELGWLND